MATPNPAPHQASQADPTLRDALVEIVQIGVRIARVTALVVEAEAQAATLMAGGLPADLKPNAAHDATMAGLAVDALDLALVQASPRIAAATLAYERAARTVRRTVALIQRLDCGWRPRGGADTKQAMARRHIARAVGERITRHATGEAAERLFDDLNERLDTLEFENGFDRPAAELITGIARDLGLPETADPAPPPAPARARTPAKPPARTAPDG